MRLVYDGFFILFGVVWYSGMEKWYMEILILFLGSLHVVNGVVSGNHIISM